MQNTRVAVRIIARLYKEKAAAIAETLHPCNNSAINVALADRLRVVRDDIQLIFARRKTGDLDCTLPKLCAVIGVPVKLIGAAGGTGEIGRASCRERV